MQFMKNCFFNVDTEGVCLPKGSGFDTIHNVLSRVIVLADFSSDNAKTYTQFIILTAATMFVLS